MQETMKTQSVQQTFKNTLKNTSKNTSKNTIVVTELFPSVPYQYQPHQYPPHLSSFTAEHPFSLTQADLLDNPCSNHPLSELWSELIDTLQYGILIVSQDCRLLYANSKAQELCQSLLSPDEERSTLPKLIVEICDRWYADHALETESLVMECLGREYQTIRIKAGHLHQYIHPNSRYENRSSAAPILIWLENCDERFEAELLIECKKYGLTDRETEVWNLLRQGYTYQEVAQALTLSMNTIKTHARHIHSKRHNYNQDSPTVWFSH